MTTTIHQHDDVVPMWEAALSKLCETDISDDEKHSIKKILVTASAKLDADIHDASAHIVDAFEEFWSTYNPAPDQDEFKPACLKVFASKVREGVNAADIIAGARIAAVKGWNHRFPWCWLNESRWIALIKQFGGDSDR
jgi:hypothetical protein